jgi:flagellar hook assembly protein FlgD
MPDQMTVTIFNSAGEIVKHLFLGTSSIMPGGFTLSASGLVEGGKGVDLIFPGEIQGGEKSLVWTGTNDNGQPVSGGTYTIQVQTTDPFGNIQTWTKSVAVLPQISSQSLNIYNSAGELVTSMNTTAFSSSPITNIGFGGTSKAAFVLGSGGGVQFVMQNSNGGQVLETWNGKSSSGQVVSPGSYIVELVSNGNGTIVMQSKGFVVLGDINQPSFTVLAGPNPVGPSDKELVFNIKGIQAGENASVQLYNVSGELISQGVGANGSSKMLLKIGNWSSGIYVAVVEVNAGPSVLNRTLLKIALDR